MYDNYKDLTLVGVISKDTYILRVIDAVPYKILVHPRSSLHDLHYGGW